MVWVSFLILGNANKQLFEFFLPEKTGFDNTDEPNRADHFNSTSFIDEQQLRDTLDIKELK